MKKINRIPFIIFACLVIGSCEKFLDRIPKDKLTATTTFTNYSSIKTYAWQFYNAFTGYSNFTAFDTERHTDLGAWAKKNSESDWIWQKVVIPTNSSDYSTPFSNIRACNILLENLDASTLSEADKNHWRSVGYFFKAFNYAELVNKYGDITWVDKNLSDSDKETLFGPRNSRDEVASKILEMLQFAVANIKTEGDGPNTINVHVVRALISRFGLREGTWRKYHGLTDADKYLNACIAASEPLLTAFPRIMPNYSQVFTSESLAGKDGILLFKRYEANQITHTASTYGGSGAGYWDLTKKAVDMYLLRDGQTRWTSPRFAGDDTPYKEFRYRDLRLYMCSCPPYQVVGPGTSTTFTHTGNPEHAEYFPIMDSLSYAVAGLAVPSPLNSLTGSRTLPWRAWSAFVVDKVPHFFDNNRGKGWSITLTGYHFNKYYTRLNENVSSKDINDAPIFRIEEVMLNYAEAKQEMGGFTQEICDNTINKLRARGKVAPLNLANIPNDPTRDPSVDPVMWEIRRERAIEFMGEGFRFDDLRRWKKMEYVTERKLGRWIVRVDENNKVPTLNNAPAGYVSYEGQPPAQFPEHYYLYPIPSNQVILTDGSVTQNPGWQ